MAVDPDGNELGVLRAIYDFGAGDVLDISGEFIPFTREAVPNIDLEMRQILVVLPDYIEAAGDGQSPDPLENGSKLSANAKDSSQESEE
jgi:16S rRNA processing protein RimM